MTSSQWIYVVVLAAIIFWSVGAYNRLVRLKSIIANAFGQIDAQLKRRYELIPSLVEAAEKYLRHEPEVLEAVIAARNQAKSASSAARSRPSNTLAINALAVAEEALSSSLHQLFGLSEAYPGLKADQTFSELSEELSSTKNKVSFAREAFNDAVLNYNNARGQFPAVLVANLFSFAPSAIFRATESAEEKKTARIAV